MSRRPSRIRGLLPTLVAAPLVGLLLWYVGSLPHSIPEVVLVVVLGAAAVTLTYRALTSTGQGVERAYWVSTPREDTVAPSALDHRLIRLRRDLRDATQDERVDEIQPVLRELTAERLRARHGIDLDAEPERARAVLDPRLWTYLSRPRTDTRRRSRSALEHAIEGIESL